MDKPKKHNKIANKILSRLHTFAADLEKGIPLAEFVATRKTPEDLREHLRDKGWKRRDRASGKNESYELWEPPWDGLGFSPLGKSLPSAVRDQLIKDGYMMKWFGRLE